MTTQELLAGAANASGWYLQVRHGQRIGLLLGPFPVKADADSWLDWTQHEAETIDSWAGFYDWYSVLIEAPSGTPLPNGRFNDRQAEYLRSLGAPGIGGGS